MPTSPSSVVLPRMMSPPSALRFRSDGFPNARAAISLSSKIMREEFGPIVMYPPELPFRSVPFQTWSGEAAALVEPMLRSETGTDTSPVPAALNWTRPAETLESESALDWIMLGTMAFEGMENAVPLSDSPVPAVYVVSLSTSSAKPAGMSLSPSQLVVPGEPTGPCGPSGPVGPGSPCGPWGPVSPWGPCGPVLPCGPCGPCGPWSP